MSKNFLKKPIPSQKSGRKNILQHVTKEIRKDFPILQRKINGKSLVYLDNAATTQKPKSVIEAIKNFYETNNANVHRGIHTLAEEATEGYEACRERVKNFVNAASEKEIIFTKGCTESINLVAYAYGRRNINQGDEIIVSILEHHSNLVPWQELCRITGAKLRVIPLTKDYTLDQKAYEKFLHKEKTKLVALSAMSNVLGLKPPIKEMIQKAHQIGAKVLIDAAQFAAHEKIDVQKLDCDFLAFSAHKMFGPTGVGILYGKESILENTEPFLYGGEMVLTVDQKSATFNELPWKFEAGTPNIADVVAFPYAINYIEKIGFENIRKHDAKMLKMAKERLAKYPKVRLYTPSSEQNTGAILSFSIDGVHPHDIASIFNEEGIAIRSGQHCAEPLVRSLGQEALARLSFSVYNDEDDIDRVDKAIQNTLKIFEI